MVCGFTSDSGSFNGNLYNPSVKARVKLDNGSIFREDAKLGPYLTAGVGFDVLDYINNGNENQSFLNIPLGRGIRWKYNDWFNITYELTHNLNLSDDYDLNATMEGGDSYLNHQLGMYFTLSSNSKDDDNDGIADEMDKCPNTPKGVDVDETGCPTVINEIKVLAKNIYFETSSDVLKSESNSSLDKVALIMTKNPNANLSIEGHTDNTGSTVGNLDLSKNRAASVKNYLLSKGIDASRIITNGYGEARPIASNDTEEGRALNRRVELIISF